MKQFALVCAALISAVGCSEAAKDGVDVSTTERSPEAVEFVAAEFNADGAPTVAFSVPNMMCEDSCVPTVRKTLAAQPGVKEVKVELATKTATVAVDEKEFDAAAAVAALVDLQFTDTRLATAADAVGDDAAEAKASDEAVEAPADAPAAEAEPEAVKS